MGARQADRAAKPPGYVMHWAGLAQSEIQRLCPNCALQIRISDSILNPHSGELHLHAERPTFGLVAFVGCWLATKQTFGMLVRAARSEDQVVH